ncbi:DUF1499 domain-containing protein [Emcibacter sp. SYSU 3D8]|uniref:DUF1499 domain-containing protein n=1 Tax=Emcibacter sp. SYSU 3D8 TaxID=3133969 RepID=UPI0031FEEDC1
MAPAGTVQPPAPAELPLRYSLAARMAGWFAVGALFMLLGAPFAYRIGLLGELLSIALFIVGATLAFCALAAGLVGIVRALMPSARVRGGLNSAVAVLIGGASLAAILHWMVLPGWDAPRIHDVTTSPKDPPEFDVARVAHYAGRDYLTYRAYDAQMQGKVSTAYPEIRTLVFDKSLRQVFVAAEAAAKDLQWTVFAADPTKGRIEAGDWSTIFGFVDDIVIRIRLNAAGYTVLDIRSASRTGAVDMGRNARRIQAFTEALDRHLPQYSTTRTP